MPEVNLNPRQLARLAMLGCIAGVVAGCGWTPRDEFYRNRSVVLAPQAGDGSQITSTLQQPGIPAIVSPQVAQFPAAGSANDPQ